MEAAPLDTTVGLLFIGFMVASVLFGVSTIQFYLVNKNYPDDAPWIKRLSLAIWLLELGHQITISHALWTSLITRAGSFSFFVPLPLSYYVAGIEANAATLLTRIFFIYRFWSMSKSPVWTILLFVTAFASSGLYLATSIKGIYNPRLSQWSQYVYLAITTSSVAALADLGIAVGTCWVLLYSRQDSAHKRTLKIIDRLLLWTFETGIITCILSVLVGILASVEKQTLVWTMFWMVGVRCYANAFFVVLNGRHYLRSIDATLSTREFPSDLPTTPTTNRRSINVDTSIRHRDSSFPLSSIPSQGSDHKSQPKSCNGHEIQVDVEMSSMIKFAPRDSKSELKSHVVEAL